MWKLFCRHKSSHEIDKYYETYQYFGERGYHIIVYRVHWCMNCESHFEKVILNEYVDVDDCKKIIAKLKESGFKDKYSYILQ